MNETCNLDFQHKDWGGARVVEWGRLLSGYRGEILGRRFESCPPRHYESAFHEERVFRSEAFREAHSWSALRRWYENVSHRVLGFFGSPCLYYPL